MPHDVKVVSKESKISGEQLFITVEGATVTDVDSADAKAMAYAERNKHGFGSAGIESAGGSMVVDDKGNILRTSHIKAGEKVKYRRVFRLTRMPI